MRILLYSLYPQYSLTTVEPIIQQVKKIDDKINVIRDFHQIESYTDLLAESIRENGKPIIMISLFLATMAFHYRM